MNVSWKPFLIDPNTATNGEEFEAYNIRRWGGSGWTTQLKQAGQKDGASFKNWKWWPNTLKAHQLIQFAEKTCGVDTGRSNAALFHALYEEGENVSLSDTLVRIGVDRLGVSDEEKLRKYLEDDTGVDRVLKDIRQCRQKYDIQSVPTFVLEREEIGGASDSPIVLSGAQSSKAFLRAFAQLAA